MVFPLKILSVIYLISGIWFLTRPTRIVIYAICPAALVIWPGQNFRADKWNPKFDYELNAALGSKTVIVSEKMFDFSYLNFLKVLFSVVEKTFLIRSQND